MHEPMPVPGEAYTPIRSELAELRPTASLAARESLSFLARRVLGLRRLSDARCDELQAGAVPQRYAERKAVEAWNAVHSGRLEVLPAAVRFLLSAELST